MSQYQPQPQLNPPIVPPKSPFRKTSASSTSLVMDNAHANAPLTAPISSGYGDQPLPKSLLQPSPTPAQSAPASTIPQPTADGAASKDQIPVTYCQTCKGVLPSQNPGASRNSAQSAGNSGINPRVKLSFVNGVLTRTYSMPNEHTFGTTNQLGRPVRIETVVGKNGEPHAFVRNRVTEARRYRTQGEATKLPTSNGNGNDGDEMNTIPEELEDTEDDLLSPEQKRFKAHYNKALAHVIGYNIEKDKKRRKEERILYQKLEGSYLFDGEDY